MYYTAKRKISLNWLPLFSLFFLAHCGMGEPAQSSKEGIQLYATDPASHKFSAALDPVSDAIGAASTSVKCALSGLNSSSIESALAGRASNGIPVTLYADRDSVKKETTVTATASRYKGFERLINTHGFSHNLDSDSSGTKTIVFGNKGDGRMSYNFCLIDNTQVIVSTAALDEDELLLEPAAVLIFGSGEDGISVDFKRELNMLSEGSFGAAKNRTDLATKYAVRDQIIGLFWGQHEDPVEEIAADILRAKKSVEFYSSSLKQTSTTASKDIVTALKTVNSTGVSVVARFSTAAREEANNLIQNIVDAGITPTYLTSEALGGTQIFIIDRGETDQRVLLYSGSLHSRGNSSDDSLLLSLKGKTSVSTYSSLLNKIDDSVNGAPIVISTLPEKDTNIALYRKTISITFDKVMDANTFSSSVLTANGELSHNITGINFTGLDATGRTAFFFVPFSVGEIVTITLNNVVKSATNKTMEQPYSFQVTTVDNGIAYLQITEIEADATMDWLEIRAVSSGILSGSKLQLYNSSGNLTEYTFPEPTTSVTADNFIVVHTQETGIDTATDYYLRPLDIQTSITATDAVLLLLDKDGYMMDFVAYADGAPATSHPALVDAAKLQAAWLTNGAAGAVQADFVNSAKDDATTNTLSRHKNTDYQDTNTHIDWVAAAASKGSENGATTAETFSLVSAQSTSSTKVEINFSHAPLRYLAETAANYSISPAISVHGATLNGTKVTLTTDAQTSSTEYTVTVNNITRFGDAATLTPNTKTFTGYIVPGAPATIAINEVSPDVTSTPFDWIELYVVDSGNTNQFALKEGTNSLMIFPSANVTAGDYILVHLKATGSEINETASKTQSSDFGSSATAWDFYSSDTGLTTTDNVITLLSPDTKIADALVFADYGGTFSGSTAEANNAITAGVWSKDGASVAETDGAWSAEVSSAKSIMRKSDNYTAESKKRYNWFVATATPGATNTGNDFARATVSSAVAPSSSSLTVTFSRNVGSVTLTDFSVTGGSSLTLSNPVIAANKVTFDTTSQTGGTNYTLNYNATGMVDPYGEPLAAAGSTGFVGYLAPASAVISEIFMDDSADACELTITAPGSLTNFTIELNDGLKYTFPSTVGFSTGDVIVVHWQATGTDEMNGNPNLSADTGHTNGYDFWFSSSTTITSTDAELTLKNNTGTVLDYAAWYDVAFGSGQSTRVTTHVSSGHWTDNGDGLTEVDLINSALDNGTDKCLIRNNGSTGNGTHTDTHSATDWSANTCNLGNNQAAP